MKNISITTLVTLSLVSSFGAPALASGGVSYRSVTSNNILKCPTNQQIEQAGYWGDGSSVGTYHTLICLNGKRRANWIIYSIVSCMSGVQICPLQDSQPKTRDNTYIFKYKKTGIGTNCNIVNRKDKYNSINYYWRCQKYTTRQNLAITTKGKEPLRSTHELFSIYGEIPGKFLLFNKTDPECKREGVSCKEEYGGLGDDRGNPNPRTYTDCRGDAQYCNFQYRRDI